MFLTKSHISLHGPAGPTTWRAPVSRVFPLFPPRLPPGATHTTDWHS